jgi:hypothetical protein
MATLSEQVRAANAAREAENRAGRPVRRVQNEDLKRWIAAEHAAGKIRDTDTVTALGVTVGNVVDELHALDGFRDARLMRRRQRMERAGGNWDIDRASGTVDFPDSVPGDRFDA